MPGSMSWSTFQRHAPAELLEHWNFPVGRPASANLSIRTAAGMEISGKDVRVLPEKTDDDSLSLTLYCKALLPLLREDENQAWWLLSTLVDQVLGEIPAMALIRGFDISDTPLDGEDMLLERFCPPGYSRMGFEVPASAGDYLDSAYAVYQMEPEQDPEADWRLDTVSGSTRLPVLVGDYLRAESDTMDLHQDGVIAGFLIYPLDTFTGENRSEANSLLP